MASPAASLGLPTLPCACPSLYTPNISKTHTRGGGHIFELRHHQNIICPMLIYAPHINYPRSKKCARALIETSRTRPALCSMYYPYLLNTCPQNLYLTGFPCSAQCVFWVLRWPCGQKLKSKNTLSDGKTYF